METAVAQIIGAGLGAAAVVGGVLLTQWRTRANTIAITEHSAKIAMEQERVRMEQERARDATTIAREQLQRQFEARAQLHRFFHKHAHRGNTLPNETDSDEAVRVASMVGGAFGLAFGKQVLDILLVNAMSWNLFDDALRSLSPYTPSKLWAVFGAHDAEMWRVIERTAAAAGVSHLEQAKPPKVD